MNIGENDWNNVMWEIENWEKKLRMEKLNREFPSDTAKE
jgi:hypothetical protein